MIKKIIYSRSIKILKQVGVLHNINPVLYVSFMVFKHSRDILIVLLTVVYYSSLFQYFLLFYDGPYSNWKFLCLIF